MNNKLITCYHLCTFQALYRAPFQVREDIEQEFYHAKTVSLQEASAMAKYSRISVHGVVQDVSKTMQSKPLISLN